MKTPSPLFLTEADVAQLLSFGAAEDAVTQAFRLLGTGAAFNHPRLRAGVQGSVLNAMWAVAPSERVMGAKVYPVTRTDVPQSATSTFLLYSLPDGNLEAVIESDTLGQRRTGAASAVATRHLARPESEVVAVFGAGWQARAQVEAIALVLPRLREVLVVNRTEQNGERFAAEISHRLGLRAATVGPQDAVAACDVIVTATGARDPLFDGDEVRPGTHLNAVGSNYPDKREIDAALLARASTVAVDARDVAALESGDLLENGFPIDATVELGAIVVGSHAGRARRDEITIFESHGLAIEDLICAAFVARRARELGIGLALTP